MKRWLGVLCAAAIVVGMAAAAGAAPSARATPGRGLADKQTIHVSAGGFPTSDVNQPIHVLECVHGATSSIDCEGGTDDPTVNLRPDGGYENNAYVVYTL